MTLDVLLISYDPIHYVGGIGTFTITLLKYAKIVNMNIKALINKPITKSIQPLRLPLNLQEEGNIYYTDKGKTYDEYLQKALETFNEILESKCNFDAVICNGILEALLSIKAIQNRIPIVLILHDKIPLYMNKYFIKLKKLDNIYNNIFVIVLSNYMKEYALGLGFDESKIFKITPGVDLEIFDPSNVHNDNISKLKSRLNINTSKNVIFCPARFDPEKGIDIFIKALSNIKDKNINIKIIFSGKYHAKELYINETKKTISEYKRYIYSLISKYNLWDNIVGGREFLQLPPFEYFELPLLYKLSTVTVLPSIDEPLGLAAIESIVMGTPVVATEVGGYVETINNNILGILVKPGNVNELSRAIYELISRSYKIYEVDTKLFDKIRRKYDARKMVKNIRDILKVKVLKG